MTWASQRRIIRISDLRLEKQAGDAVLSARIEATPLGWRNQRLWIRMPADLAPGEARGDPFIAGLLIGAMAARCGLVVDAALSPSLAANLEAAQAMLVAHNDGNAWARLHRIRIASRSSREPARRRRGRPRRWPSA